MIEKILNALIAYCFGVADVLCIFIERTHAVVGVGAPLLLMTALHLYMPTWVAAGVAALLLSPAAVAMIAAAGYGLLSTRPR